MYYSLWVVSRGASREGAAQILVKDDDVGLDRGAARPTTASARAICEVADAHGAEVSGDYQNVNRTPHPGLMRE